MELDEEQAEPQSLVGPELVQVTRQQGERVRFRCLVAANPLPQATIVQVEWLKDSQRIDQLPVQAQQAGHFLIERANQLHMGSQPGQQKASELLASSRLLDQSTLTLAELEPTIHSGHYSCHFRLIPTPGQTQQQQQAAKIVSGRAKQTYELKVLQGKWISN